MGLRIGPTYRGQNWKGTVTSCETKYSTRYCETLRNKVFNTSLSSSFCCWCWCLWDIHKAHPEFGANTPTQAWVAKSFGQPQYSKHKKATKKTTPGRGERPEQQQRCSTSWDQQTFMWDLIIQPHIRIILIIIINIIMLMIIIFNMHNLFNGYQVNQNQVTF